MTTGCALWWQSLATQLSVALVGLLVAITAWINRRNDHDARAHRKDANGRP